MVTIEFKSKNGEIVKMVSHEPETEKQVLERTNGRFSLLFFDIQQEVLTEGEKLIGVEIGTTDPQESFKEKAVTLKFLISH